jgi:hypothetical protein
MGYDSQNPATEYHGLIHEVRMWNTARTQQQIQSSMSVYLSGNEPGLIGYWRMNEGSGQVMTDYSPYSNDGVLGATSNIEASDPLYVSGCPLTAPSSVATGLMFDGVNDRATIPHHSAYDLGHGDFTFEAWIKADSTQTGIPVILSNRGTLSTGFLVMLYNHVLAIQAGSFNTLTTSNDLYDNICHHIACTRLDSNLTFYLDGNVLPLNPLYNSFSPYSITDSHDLWIGFDSPNSGTEYKGIVHEVRMWNMARTHQQIQSNMSIYLTGNEPGLIGYWRMNEGSGQVISDLSVYHNNGVLGATANIESSDPVFTAGCILISGIVDESAGMIGEMNVFPNPANSTITISYSLSKKGKTGFEIYNSFGQMTGSDPAKLLQEGSYQQSYDISELAAGIYFVKMTVDGFTSVKRFCKL